MQDDLKPYGSKRNIWIAKIDNGVIVSCDRSAQQCVCSKRPTQEEIQELIDEVAGEGIMPGIAHTYAIEFAETKKGTWKIISVQGG